MPKPSIDDILTLENINRMRDDLNAAPVDTVPTFFVRTEEEARAYRDLFPGITVVVQEKLR